jgi:hypothetical protein
LSSADTLAVLAALIRWKVSTECLLRVEARRGGPLAEVRAVMGDGLGGQGGAQRTDGLLDPLYGLRHRGDALRVIGVEPASSRRRSG